MNVNAGFAVGVFANHARNDGYLQLDESVGDAIIGYGANGGIAINHFVG